MKITRYIAALILAIFGFLTLYLSASILLDLFDMRSKQGDFVDFVVWANLACSLIYLLASCGFVKKLKFTTKILFSALSVLIITLITFLIYINYGGIHKEVTTKALIFRISITLIFSTISYYTITKKHLS